MTGILVTKFKMGLIGVKDLAEMAADESRTERCSAAKRVLAAVKDLPDLSCQQDVLPISDPLLQKR
jgi:hypothetical protein